MPWLLLSLLCRGFGNYLCSLLPTRADPEEVQQLMQGLPALRPGVLQTLLQDYRSVKTKRLFLVLAEILDHPWLKELDVEKVDLGSGKRSLKIAGRLHPEYKITVPAVWEELEGHDQY